MKFFVPHTKDDKQAEEVYSATRKFVAEQMGAKLSPRKVFRLEYVHNGKREQAEVGRENPVNHETTMVILFDPQRDLYYVCTPDRAVLRGGPILVGGNEVQEVVDFEE